MASHSKAHTYVELPHLKRAIKEVNKFGISWLREMVDSSDSWRVFLNYEDKSYPLKPLVARATQVAINDDTYKSTIAHTNDARNVARRLGLAENLSNQASQNVYDSSLQAEREWISRLARKGHSRFREKTLELWSDRCAVTGVRDRGALEAAHVKPHAENGPMNPSNGIALRADLHRLFDLDLIALNPETLRLEILDGLSSEYSQYHGVQVALPEKGPKPKDFAKRWEDFLDTWEAP